MKRSNAVGQHGVADRDLPLHRFLSNLALECDTLADGTEQLQVTLAEVLTAPGVALDAKTVRTLQDLDRITQTLGSLSQLTGRAATDLAEVDLGLRGLATVPALPSVIQRLLRQTE